MLYVTSGFGASPKWEERTETRRGHFHTEESVLFVSLLPEKRTLGMLDIIKDS